jgi:biotin carboxylase
MAVGLVEALAVAPPGSFNALSLRRSNEHLADRAETRPTDDQDNSNDAIADDERQTNEAYSSKRVHHLSESHCHIHFMSARAVLFINPLILALRRAGIKLSKTITCQKRFAKYPTVQTSKHESATRTPTRGQCRTAAS